MSPVATCPDAFQYLGDELEIFALASNWKAYIQKELARHLRGEVAEVGAGIGGTSQALACSPGVTRWVCIEPDAVQASQIATLRQQGALPAHCEVHVGRLEDLPPEPAFDSIVYVDVLEHIHADRFELDVAAARLNPRGKIIVLSPAWQFLYGEFDRRIGHWRRYTIPSLREVAPRGTVEVESYYLDSVGLLASLANRLLLRQSLPTRSQILMWDRIMVPISRIVDPLIARRLGRSVVMVWLKCV